MPAQSEKQRRLLNWKFGHKWVKEHHFDNPGKLPLRKRPKRKPRPKRRGRKGNIGRAADRVWRKWKRSKAA